MPRLGAAEEDSSINIVSDGETNGDYQMSPRNELKNQMSPSKKRMRASHGISEETKPGILENLSLFFIFSFFLFLIPQAGIF